MITIEQCRAGRGLLGWTQQDLADACGLSKTAINNFEKGHSDIKYESLRAIRMAFEAAQVELTGQDGVRKKTDHAAVFKGDLAVQRLYEDIYDTMQERAGGGAVMIADRAGLMMRFLTDDPVRVWTDRLTKAGVTLRVISHEAPPTYAAAQSRAALADPANVLGYTVYLYADKIAFVLANGQVVLILTSDKASHHEMRRFESAWAGLHPFKTNRACTDDSSAAS